MPWKARKIALCGCQGMDSNGPSSQTYRSLKLWAAPHPAEKTVNKNTVKRISGLRPYMSLSLESMIRKPTRRSVKVSLPWAWRSYGKQWNVCEGLTRVRQKVGCYDPIAPFEVMKSVRDCDQCCADYGSLDSGEKQTQTQTIWSFSPSLPGRSRRRGGHTLRWVREVSILWDIQTVVLPFPRPLQHRWCCVESYGNYHHHRAI